MINIPTPNAASMGIYGQIPVSLFTGTPNINIPLYELMDSKLDVPVSLSYHPSLVKPDQQPGWVGLGWNLNCGGSITRISKGNNLYDECGNSDHETYSYYDNYDKLDYDDWYTTSHLTEDQDASKVDVEPDEFMFNFAGYSGKFFLNHEGKWVVQSQSPVQIEVEHTLNSGQFNGPLCNNWNYFILNRFYIAFKLTTGDGAKYYFGNDPDELNHISDTNDFKAIEFSVDVTEGRPNIIGSVIPTTWYLVKVESPDGHIIEYNYKRGCPQYNLSSFFQVSSSDYSYELGNCSTFSKILGISGLGLLTFQYSLIFNFDQTCAEGPHSVFTNIPIDYRVNLLFPSYIDEITASTGKIKFVRSRTDQLTFNKNIINDHSTGDGSIISPSLTYSEKLDSINIYDNNNKPVRSINFYYNNDSNRRLRLGSVKEISSNKEGKVYSFTYNPTFLPDYNSGKIDHWGFYKGGPSYFSVIDEDSIKITRSADTTDLPYMEAEILTKITYPTGGTTEFDYELHDYSAILDRYPFDLTDQEQNLTTGGLRIKKITSKDTNGDILSEKEYFYIKDYISGSALSSGILAGLPEYTEGLGD